MLKKNDIITTEIIDYSSDGNGVARYENMVIFVPFTAVGDVCEIKIVKVLSGYSFGRCEKIITPSQDRIQPLCPISRTCGGCDFQHISYEAEKTAKHNFVKSVFERIAKLDCEVRPTLSCDEHTRYRNKAQFPVSTDENGKAITGFYASRSHRVVPCEDCLLQPVELNEIAQQTVKLLNQLKIKGYNEEKRSGIVRHIYLRKAWVTGEIMLCLVCTTADFKNRDMLCSLLKEKFPAISTIVININNKNTNVILGEKNYTVFGKGKITDILCGVEIEISPHSFYQVNHDGAQQLYSIAKESLHLTDEDIHILMLMMTCHKLNIRPITPQCLSRYSSLALSRIDEIMLKLINGHFVNRCNGQLDFKPIQMKLLDEKEEKKEDVNLVSFFEESFGRSLSVTEIGFINDFKRSGYDDEMIMDAVKEAVKANVKNFRYVERILQNWSEYGKVIKTKEEESVSSFSDEVKDFKWWG